MHSIPLAMTWELFARGRWWLLGAFLLGNLLPAILLFALRHQGGVDPADPSILIMHFVLTQINMLIFASALMTAQGHPKRLYAMPVPTTTIVTWHLLPAMLLMALEVAASAAMLNAVFDLGWPIWGPALLMAVGFAAVSATLWLTEKSFWLPWALAGVAGPLGLWYKSQHGSMFSQPEHHWLEITLIDAAILAGIAALAFIVAVVGVARNRRGDPLGSLGILDWLERAYLPPKLDRPFRSPLAAQSWFELRQKAWAMPATVVFGLFVGMTMWVIVSRDLQELWKGLIAGVVMLAIVGMIGGAIAGNNGPLDSNIAMGHFLATRPITTRDLANTILKTLLGSVVVAWGIWLAAILVLYSILLMIPGQRPEIPREIDWWELPATLFMPWITAGITASILLCGRVRPFAELFIGGMALLIGTFIFVNMTLSAPARTQFYLAVAAGCGILFFVGTVSAFIAAYRRDLISSRALYASAALWIAISAPFVFAPDALVIWNGSFANTLFFIGILALAFAPLPAAPLALAWNRNR